MREVDSHSHSTLVTLQAKPAQRVTANGTRRCLLFPLLDWQPAVSHGMSCSAWLCLLGCVARTCTSSRRVYGESGVGTRRLHTLYVMFTFCVLHASNFAAVIVHVRDARCHIPRILIASTAMVTVAVMIILLAYGTIVPAPLSPHRSKTRAYAPKPRLSAQ